MRKSYWGLLLALLSGSVKAATENLRLNLENAPQIGLAAPVTKDSEYVLQLQSKVNQSEIIGELNITDAHPVINTPNGGIIFEGDAFEELQVESFDVKVLGANNSTVVKKVILSSATKEETANGETGYFQSVEIGDYSFASSSIKSGGKQLLKERHNVKGKGYTVNLSRTRQQVAMLDENNTALKKAQTKVVHAEEESDYPYEEFNRARQEHKKLKNHARVLDSKPLILPVRMYFSPMAQQRLAANYNTDASTAMVLLAAECVKQQQALLESQGITSIKLKLDLVGNYNQALSTPFQALGMASYLARINDDIALTTVWIDPNENTMTGVAGAAGVGTIPYTSNGVIYKKNAMATSGVLSSSYNVVLSSIVQGNVNVFLHETGHVFGAGHERELQGIADGTACACADGHDPVGYFSQRPWKYSSSVLNNNLAIVKGNLNYLRDALAVTLSYTPTIPSAAPIKTNVPTIRPTTMLSKILSKMPSLMPTAAPTRKPITPSPSFQPSKITTLRPTTQPTPLITRLLSKMPTLRPTGAPTKKPSKMPTMQPSAAPLLAADSSVSSPAIAGIIVVSLVLTGAAAYRYKQQKAKKSKKTVVKTDIEAQAKSEVKVDLEIDLATLQSNNRQIDAIASSAENIYKTIQAVYNDSKISEPKFIEFMQSLAMREILKRASDDTVKQLLAKITKQKPEKYLSLKIMLVANLDEPRRQIIEHDSKQKLGTSF